MANGNEAEKKSRCCSDEANQARREEILQTATELFAEQGFSDAVTQRLVERLGVGKGTLYRHFPSKRALFLAATDRVMRKMQECVSQRVAGIEDGLERIERGIATFLQFFADHPSFVEVLIQERAYFKDRKRPTYFEHREINIQRWKQLYLDLMAAGRMRELPVDRITTVLSNVLYGIMVTNFFNGQPAPADVQAREILDVIFVGVLSDTERRRFLAGRSTSDDETTGGGPFGGASDHEENRVDPADVTHAGASGDLDGLSTGEIAADAADAHCGV